MNNVKLGLKKLHSKEFASIEDRIRKWEETLDMVQTDMQANPTNDQLHIQEKEAITQIKKWRMIEDKALLQKSRINWLRNRDENSTYFHAIIKERRTSNGIYELKD